MPLPAQIGPYRVLRQIGMGGMGMVLEAIHSTIERRVAIKLLLPQYAKDATVTERLFREALAVNRIEHPSLVQVSDFGQMADGTVYLVMEFLRGQTLASWMEQNSGPVQAPMVIKIAAQVASALAAAHSKGIVHRDLKPDNLMLVEDAVDPRAVKVKLLDFGIAKVVQEQAPSKAKTATDLVMGTPYYMSPEQCQGAGYVDAKSDVYSLGVMLFHLLSGRLPFEGEGSGQLIGMHLFKPPPLLRELTPSVPAGLAELVQGLLAKNRDARPTMEELRGEFESMVRAGSNEPSTAIIARIHLQAVSLGEPHRRGAATTLSGSNGQSQIRGLNGRRKWMLAAGVLTLLLAGVATKRQNSGAPSRAEPPTDKLAEPTASLSRLAAPSAPIAVEGSGAPPHSSKRVKWSIVSQPPEAEIINIATGYSLGRTPWERESPTGAQGLKVRVRRDGYLEESLTLEGDTSARIELILRRPTTQPAAPHPKTPVGRPPPHPKAPEPKRSSFPLED